MDLGSIARSVVRRRAEAARLPLDVGLKLAGRGRAGEAAVDRAEAAARDVAGTALGDDELRRDAKLRRTAADERDRGRDIREARRDARAGSASRPQTGASRRRSARGGQARGAREQARRQRKPKAADTARGAAGRRPQVAEAKEERLETRAKHARLAQLDERPRHSTSARRRSPPTTRRSACAPRQRAKAERKTAPTRQSSAAARAARPA